MSSELQKVERLLPAAVQAAVFIGVGMVFRRRPAWIARISVFGLGFETVDWWTKWTRIAGFILVIWGLAWFAWTAVLLMTRF